MSKVDAQERELERELELELVRRRLERHRRGRWFTRPFTFAMNIKQKKDDVLSGKPRRGGSTRLCNRCIAPKSMSEIAAQVPALAQRAALACWSVT